MSRARAILILAAAAPIAGVGPVPAVAAAAQDPAIATIEGLDGALLEAMKAGKSAGVDGRFRKLLAAVDRAFDLTTMVRFAVGSSWSTVAAADQSALARAFGRLTAANLAHNFDAFDGEVFKINPEVQTRGPDKLVRTLIVPASGEPTELNYRMRESGGSWKIIDVYFGAVSQLTAQRSDFAAAFASGGAAALIKSMNAKVDKLIGS